MATEPMDNEGNDGEGLDDAEEIEHVGGRLGFGFCKNAFGNGAGTHEQTQEQAAAVGEEENKSESLHRLKGMRPAMERPRVTSSVYWSSSLMEMPRESVVTLTSRNSCRRR